MKEFVAGMPGARPARVRQVDGALMLVQLVAGGNGVAVLPRWMAAEHVAKGWVSAVALGDGAGWGPFRAVLREADLAQAWVQDFFDAVRVAALATLHGVRPVAAGFA